MANTQQIEGWSVTPTTAGWQCEWSQSGYTVVTKAPTARQAVKQAQGTLAAANRRNRAARQAGMGS